ncbi:MAG: alpha-galactosidase [Eubacterium sp.]|nr:alpha-galactosidase [Eubacterium sp.]
MSIIYQKEKKIFTLHTAHTTYQMQVDSYGFLLHLYYGRKTPGHMDYLLTYADRGFSGNPYDAGKDRTYSMDVLPQEFPTSGTGDFRSPALIIRNADGSYSCDLRYQGHSIEKGKYRLPCLPAVYAGEDEAETLIIHMKDPVTDICVDLLYGVLPESDIITRAARIRNESEKKVTLMKTQTACLDFLTGDYDLITFHGRHAMERNMERKPILHSAQVIGSRRGTSSHQYNPMMIAAEHGATEDAGTCYGLSFVYSGSFKGEAEKDQFEQTRIQLGLMDEMFSYPLEPGQLFLAPEVILTCSTEGLARLSHNLHQCIRDHVCRGAYRDGGRPVLLNSWEACYFDFDGEAIYQLARQAADLGLDMLVLDDGWFGKRDSDYSGLGDWYVNEDKLGESLGHLVKRVTDLGLRFGIWFEPEAINEDSDLYRQHPDWVLKIPGRDPVRARYQLVLDYSRPEVVDAIFDAVCRVLDQGDITYVKWDMNRSICDVYSMETDDQGRVLYDYMLGLYDFLDRLLARYPNLLLEGCSGGGGRFDAGMLYYSPQIWCSDNTDAMDRLHIQYGTSFGYPISAVGSHVSAVPNHQTGRVTPIETRAVTAMAGTFGYELDPYHMTEEDKNLVRDQIRRYKAYAPLIQHGLYYRLTDPRADQAAAWEFAAEDGSEVLVQVVMQEIHGNMTNNYIRLKGLRAGALYEDAQTGRIYPADALMQVGWPVPIEPGDYQAWQKHFVIRDYPDLDD